MHTPARSRWGRAAGSTPSAALRTAGGSTAVYRPRNPTATVLYPIVQHHLETFLARAGEADPLGGGVPHWVENDFRAYLRCGILAHGFARARGDGCGSERLIVFSCKGRGICPSCNARRMVQVAAHLTDHGLPPLPLRQCVLSLPKRLRPFLHRDPDLAGAVLRNLLRAVRATLERACPDAPSNAQLGAVSFIQRFGGSLNSHFHFHVLVLDGLFTQADDGSLHFHEVVQLTGEDARHVERTVQRHILRHFVRRGLIEDYASRDMLTWQAAGGFSVDASVRIPGHDRAGRERLIRYCARPPFALERLRADFADQEPTRSRHRGAEHATVHRVVYLLTEPAPDGRTVLAFTPDGRLIRRFGRSGGGPGEYRSVSDVALGEDGRLALFPRRHDAAFDLYDLEGRRSSIGRGVDLPYVCMDRLVPGPDCRVKRPCYMCHRVALGPDLLALVDRAGAQVRLFDAAGAVVRTWDLASVEPMRTWRAQERERLQKFWDEGQRAHRCFVADALPWSQRDLVLSIVPHRPERNGRRLWGLDVESGEVRRFAWDTPTTGNAIAIGEAELFTVNQATVGVVRYRCPADPAATGAGTATAKNRGHARSPANRAHGCLSVRPESRSVTDRAS